MLRWLLFAIGALVLGSCLIGSTRAAGTCGLAQAAFCETFDASSPVFNRSGQLDGNVWGVSRVTGRTNGYATGMADPWSKTTLQTCGGPVLVSPPNDVIICNGQLHEAVNDAHDVTVLAMYPKQPFDFAGRTGTIAFDVSNDTHGIHAAWPEVWITDKPSPAPFTHLGSWNSPTQNAFGVRMARFGGTIGSINCAGKWSVDSVVASRNYVIDEGIVVNALDCVTLGSATAMNHIEVRVSQAAADVWATDAGATTLKHIASIPNANLSLSRGLVWLEDVHYNGDKDGPDQGTHTFVWDNVGFDGPFTYRDLSFDVLDRLAPSDDPNALQLGWRFCDVCSTGSLLNVNTLPMTAAQIASAESARLMFNFQHYDAPLTFNWTVNGHAHTSAWPYPDTQTNTPRTIAFDIPLTDLVAGPNNVTLRAAGGQLLVVMNVNIVLVNAGGATSTPTSTPTIPAPTPTQTSSPTPSPTLVPTSSPSPVPTQTPSPLPTSTQTVPSPTPTATPGHVCNEAYFLDGVLAVGPPRPCP